MSVLNSNSNFLRLLLPIFILIIFKLTAVNCVNCKYYPAGYSSYLYTYCSFGCCGGFPSNPSSACCSDYVYTSSYWWISIIVIVIVIIVAATVCVILCCIFKRRRRQQFGGRVVYKPPTTQQSNQAPYVIGSNQASTHYPEYPVQNASPSEQSAHYINPTADKPPAYENIVFINPDYNHNQPATVNVSVQDRNGNTASASNQPAISPATAKK